MVQTFSPNARELFRLIARVRERGDPDPGGGTAYALNAACPACGTGARQISPLRLLRSDLPKANKLISQTYCNWILLNDRVTDPMREQFDVAGDLISVEDGKKGGRFPYWQIRPRFVMPRMAPETKHIVAENFQCPHCKRDGYAEDWAPGLEPVQIAYRLDRKTQAKLPALAQSWECFGRSVRVPKTSDDLVGFAVPLTLARGDVCEFLRRFIPARQLEFEPVRILPAD